MTTAIYSEDTIRTLDWKEHIRKRPGMYIGKLGDGSSQDDGIYVLVKEVLDNAIDEYMMGFGKTIDITINENIVQIRDYGRGIPLGKVIDVASKMNTGAKYDSRVFKKSVGLNGVGIKAVNALSSFFEIKSFREGKVKAVSFNEGNLQQDDPEQPGDSKNGTLVSFVPDQKMFGHFRYMQDYLEAMIKNYVYLNSGLTIFLNGTPFYSKDGLVDLLHENVNGDGLYPIIQIKDEDIELAMTHGSQYLTAFKEALVKTIREFYKKDFDPADIRVSIVTALSIKVEEPVFESQTKTKLGSREMAPDGVSIRNFITDFLKKHLDNFLHKHPETADILLKKIIEAEKERKAISGIQKLARERAKKSNLHNRKLRDCKIHLNDNNERRLDATIFITEGDSASGSITTSRDVATQAVFSLKGKPLNVYGLTKKIVYENEEFNLLQAALDIEDGLENLRYNNVVIATDADVDGMHIRLLMMTFFLQFFPELVRQGHLYVLQTPLFRVRNKKQTLYCYNIEEKESAVKKLGVNPEITRFKGLGEISPDEFRHFIGKDIRLEPVRVKRGDHIQDILPFFMGKNTPERQDFIIENLRVEEDVTEAL
jgi:topoisomerase-4 subunit B